MLRIEFKFFLPIFLLTQHELYGIVGKKFLAPYNSCNGRAYHNAFVCSLDDTSEYDENIDVDNIKIKILFMNPTHREMVPCSYFLDGSCKFDSDRCHYSHGELVLYKELRDYKEPNFQMLQQISNPVLVKQSDRIWYKAKVVSSNFDEKTCTVRLDRNKKEISCEFADILPIEFGKFTLSNYHKPLLNRSLHPTRQSIVRRIIRF